MKLKIYIPSVILLAVVLVNAFFIGKDIEDDKKHVGALNNVQAYVFPVLESTYLPLLNSNIDKPEVNAKSAIVFDTRSSRVLYSKNVDQRLPIASLTKIMTAIVALEKFDLNDVVKITENSVRVDKEKQTLYLDEELTVSDLLNLLLVESSNDAAYALLEFGKSKNIDFVKAMNDKALELGMGNTLFLDPAGLDDGAYSTVNDLKKIISYAVKFDVVWEITKQKGFNFNSRDGKVKHIGENTNQLLDSVPYVTGGKTGYTEGALGCMILLVNVPQQPTQIVSVVLGSKDRFGDTQRLIGWVQQAYRWE